MNPPLNYMPPVQHRVQRTWPGQIVALAVLVVGMGLAIAYEVWLVPLIAGLPAGFLFWQLLHDAGADARWAYVLEGRSLTFRRPSDAGWATLQVDDVAALYKVRRDEAWEVEVVFGDGRRVFVEAQVFGSLGRFMKGFQSLRPEIALRERGATACPGCHRGLYGSTARRCPDCGIALARPLPPVAADGVVLPKGLAWL